MEIRELARRVRQLAQEALHIDPAHGHAERLAQTANALEAIETLTSEHAATPATVEATAPGSTQENV